MILSHMATSSLTVLKLLKNINLKTVRFNDYMAISYSLQKKYRSRIAQDIVSRVLEMQLKVKSAETRILSLRCPR